MATFTYRQKSKNIGELRIDFFSQPITIEVANEEQAIDRAKNFIKTYTEHHNRSYVLDRALEEFVRNAEV